jgi:hypothetical protein
MKISLFTGRYKDPKRKSHVQEASKVSAEHGAQFLILPGYSLGPGQDDPAAIQRFADESGLHILAEAHNTHQLQDTFCFRPNEEPLGPFIQYFHRGANATRDAIQQVTEEFQEGKRLFKVEGKTIGVLLCGENNILRNVKNNNYEPRPRHRGLKWHFVYDVLVNPAHDTMGEWHLLHKRFAYFSRGGRTLLYCTNNNRSSSWKISLCVYRDGRKVLMGDDLTEAKDPPTKISDGWRLVTVEVT